MGYRYIFTHTLIYIYIYVYMHISVMRVHFFVYTYMYWSFASVSSCVGALLHDGVHGCISTHFDVYLHTLIYIYIYVIYA